MKTDDFFTFILGWAVGCMVNAGILLVFGLEPTPKQYEAYANKNPEMCLSVCVEQFEKMGC